MGLSGTSSLTVGVQEESKTAKARAVTLLIKLQANVCRQLGADTIPSCFINLTASFHDSALTYKVCQWQFSDHSFPIKRGNHKALFRSLILLLAQTALHGVGYAIASKTLGNHF